MNNPSHRGAGTATQGAVEVLSARTVFVPREVLEKMQAAASFQQEAADLFSASGLPLQSGERVVVCGGGEPCALAAVLAEMAESAGVSPMGVSTSGIEFTTPLLAPRPAQGDVIYALHRPGLLYVKIWGSADRDWMGLRFAEVLTVESLEQALFDLARLGQMYCIECAPVYYHGPRTDRKLLRRYFGKRLHFSELCVL